MRDQVEQRLKQLKAEFENGQTMLSELETKEANLKTTLLRISGAIQVLEELLPALEDVDVSHKSEMLTGRE